MEHTPTPWATFGWKNGFTCGIQGTKPMHRVTSDNVFRVDDDLDMANAEFIVRAVNCHDELVEALNATLHELGLVCSYSGRIDTQTPAMFKAKQALAKAEGR